MSTTTEALFFLNKTTEAIQLAPYGLNCLLSGIIRGSDMDWLSVVEYAITETEN
jgi:hypothetical protein